MIRVATGALLATGGAVLAALSTSALMTVGTGEVARTEPFPVSVGAYAIVLDEAIVPFEGSTATLTVESDQALFLGTANGVDVDDFLTGVAHDEITDVHFPDSAEHRTVAGDPAPAADAASRDWWTEQDTGTTVSHTFDLDADPQMIVVTAAQEGASPAGAQVSLSMDVHKVLGLAVLGYAGAAALLGGAAFMLLRWWFSRFRPVPRTGRAQHVQRTSRRGGRS